MTRSSSCPLYSGLKVTVVAKLWLSLLLTQVGNDDNHGNWRHQEVT